MAAKLIGIDVGPREQKPLFSVAAVCVDVGGTVRDTYGGAERLGRSHMILDPGGAGCSFP